MDASVSIEYCVSAPRSTAAFAGDNPIRNGKPRGVAKAIDGR